MAKAELIYSEPHLMMAMRNSYSNNMSRLRPSSCVADVRSGLCQNEEVMGSLVIKAAHMHRAS